MESQNFNHNSLEEEITKICQEIWHLAEKSGENISDLVIILRHLEQLHREIREQMLEPSLPDTRHRLYLLLRHLEETGGWPYIPRMRLKELCQRLEINHQSQSESKASTDS